MKRAGLPVLAALLLASCTTVPIAADAQEWDLVAFETNSWGRVVSGWTMGSSGEGGWWVRQGPEGEVPRAPVGPYRIVYHEFDAGPEGFARIAALLEDLPDPAPVATDCSNFRTDDLYGTLRLTREASTREIAWNRGCRDPSYRAFMERLEDADALVEEWGSAAPIHRIEHFDAGGKGVRMQFIEPVVPATGG